MSGQRIAVILALALLAVCIAAYVDGGEEALHPIEQPIAHPENAR